MSSAGRPNPQQVIYLREAPLRPTVAVNWQKAFDAARRARFNGQTMQAEYLCEQLVAAAPGHREASLLLLECYRLIGRGRVAEDLARRLLEEFPRDPAVLLAVARHSRNDQRPGEALQLLEKALRLDPKNAEIYYELGQLNVALGDRDEAVANLSKAVRLNPGHGNAFYARALALKGSSPDEHLQEIERSLARLTLDPLNTGMTHLAAAWCWDKKDMARQFAHLDAGNEALTRRLPWSRLPWSYDYSHQQFELISGLFSREFCLDPVNFAGSAESPIFIAALPRSGTTLLEQILGAHSAVTPIGESAIFNFATSEIAFREGRDTQYWNWPRPAGFGAIAGRHADWYRGHAAVQRSAGRRVVEKSLDNYMNAGLILTAFPRARIIHLQRHPLDVILSMYQLFIAAGANIPFRLDELAMHYLLVEEYMAHWKSVFPDRVLTVKYETMVTEQEKTIREILAFCELPWEDSCLRFHERESTVNTPSAFQVRKALNRDAVGRWQPYAAYLAPAAKVLGIALPEEPS